MKRLMSASDPGCVKTRLSQGRSELFPQLRPASSTYQCDWFPQRPNRDGNSTRKFSVRVFTQPGPDSDMGQTDWLTGLLVLQPVSFPAKP
jgi:hypothetical protein